MRLFLLIIIYLLSCSTSYALYPHQGWYLGFVFGPSGAPGVDFEFTIPVLNYERTGSVSYDMLGMVGGQLGYRRNSFRLELEGMFNSSPYRQLVLGRVFLKNNDLDEIYMSGSTQTSGAFINLFYDFYDVITNNSNEGSRAVPYVGAGFGYVSIYNQIKIFNEGTIIGDPITFSNRTGMGQLIAGINYFVDDYMTFGLDTRYLVSTEKTSMTTSVAQIFAVVLTVNNSFDRGR